MVDRTAEFLLLHGGHRLPHNSAASATDCSAAHAFPQHSAGHSAAHSAANTAANPATHPTHTAAAPAAANCSTSADWTSRSIQLRGGSISWVGWRQAGVVLQNPPHLRRPAHTTTSSGRSLQLRRWIRELAGRMVSAEERVVLQSTWQRLSESGRWWVCVTDRHITTI